MYLCGILTILALIVSYKFILRVESANLDALKKEFRRFSTIKHFSFITMFRHAKLMSSLILK
jgi:hypothetical protein